MQISAHDNELLSIAAPAARLDDAPAAGLRGARDTSPIGRLCNFQIAVASDSGDVRGVWFKESLISKSCSNRQPPFPHRFFSQLSSKPGARLRKIGDGL
jgi:hypothetical protein